MLAIGLALCLAGWALDTQTQVETDIQKLVPQNLGALRNLSALEQATGVGGEIDVTVATRDLTDPRVVRWMTSYEGDLLKRYRYSPTRGCGKAELCPAFSLPDLFQQGTSTLSQADIRDLLDAVPPYFSQGVITSDRRVATLAFGIRLMPLDEQHRVIQEMRRRLRPPPGVHAELAGLTVLAADANAKVTPAWRRELMLLAGLAAVALVLLATLRRRRRALIPLVPIVMATGWSSLVVFAIRIPLNPMSVTLGALVIAISTEFSVLLSERFRQERLRGHDTAAALERTYRSTGAAVLASGATAIAGFGVLVLSNIAMLRDFGIVTVVDLAVSLLGVMILLPAALVLAERGELARLPGQWLRGVRPARGRAPARDMSPPEEPGKPPVPGPTGSRYAWFAGVVGLLIVALITLNTATTTPNGSRGIQAGNPLAPFAVPIATGPLNGDADIATAPGQGQKGRHAACQVRGPGILNICELYERGPVVLAIFVASGSCPAVLDDLERLRVRYPGVQFAAVAIKGSRGALRALVSKRGWGFPVGYDRDGALASLYKVTSCPQVTLAYPGGIVAQNPLLSRPAPAALQAAIDALRTGSVRRGRPPA